MKMLTCCVSLGQISPQMSLICTTSVGGRQHIDVTVGAGAMRIAEEVEEKRDDEGEDDRRGPHRGGAAAVG
jgi:hypothetical protein